MAESSHLPLGNKNFISRGACYTNRRAVRIAAPRDGVLGWDLTVAHGKCTRLYVPLVARTPKFHSSRGKVGRSTAVTASLRRGAANDPSDDPTPFGSYFPDVDVDVG